MIYETLRDSPDRHSPATGRRGRLPVCERKLHPASSSPRPAAMLYLRPLKFAGPALQFCSFDASYIDSLRAGDRATQEHFVGYFTELLRLKLRSKLQSPQAVEDVRQ